MTGKITVRGVVYSALFAALLVVFSWIRINLGVVPITLENMAVMLAGAVLGPVYGFFSMLLVVVLTALGLPILDGSGGVGLLVGPTGGFVWMWPINALLTGYFVSRIKGRGPMATLKMFVLVFIFGSLLDYVSGVPWLKHVIQVPWSKAMVLGFYPYIPGDLLKALATAIVVTRVRVFFPRSLVIGRRNTAVKLD